MKDYTCTVCGYVYSETMGIPGIGIAPGTLWEDLPDDWTCPLCGATKAEFVEQSNEAEAKPQSSTQYETSSDMLELTPLQASALCSNLARGCDMLEKKEESALFIQLADYFKEHAQPIEAPDSHTLHALIENDLRSGIYAAYNLALKEKDRGALRALAWNKKVTKILNSLMIRYQQQGISMITNTSIYVCTICGFVHIGDAPPVRCPVCKAPQQKMEKVEGRAS